MRILFFHPDGHPTFRPDVSVLFGKYLGTFGIDCDIVSHGTGQPADSSTWKRSTLYLSNGGRIVRYLFVLKMALLHNFRKYDAIIVRDMPIAASYVLLRAFVSRRPFLYWRSFPLPQQDITILKRNWKQISWRRRAWLAIKGGVGTLLERLLLANSLPAHMFVQSNAMARELRGWGTDPRKLTAVPMCVDPERFPEPDRQPGSAVPRVIYIGACDRSRGVEVLIRMMEELQRRGSNVVLSLVGDAMEPADKEWLRTLITNSSAADKIDFTGWVSTTEVDLRLKQANLAISLVPVDPIYRAASPTKLVEYMASAIPVIVNDHADQTELVTASGGGIISQFNAVALADCVLSIVGSGRDGAAMGVAGRSHVLMHRNYVSMAEYVASVIKNAIRH